MKKDERLEHFLKAEKRTEYLRSAFPWRVTRTGKDRTLAFFASTQGVKRDGNTIRTSGWELDNYLKTGAPVLWSHDLRQPAIGIAPSMRKDRIGGQDVLACEVTFAQPGDYAFADTLYRLYSSDPPIMRAGSVQWNPLEWYPRTDAASKQSLGGYEFVRQELLEFSLVPVPADPDAIMRSVQTGMLTSEEAEKLAWRLGGDRPLPITVRIDAEMPTEETRSENEPAHADVKGGDPDGQGRTDQDNQHGRGQAAAADEGGQAEGQVVTAVEARGAVGFGSQASWPQAPEDSPWDGSKAVTGLRAFSGGADKSKIDWGKYAQGFGWFDSANRESFGAYKLPHHIVLSGKIAQHWRGTAAAMGALLGARGGTSIPAGDKHAVFSHLSGHYKSFGKEPPVFRSFGSLEELDRVWEEQEWTCDEDTLCELRTVLVEENAELGFRRDVESCERASTKVQTVLCAKTKFRSVDEARTWITSHGFKDGGVDETPDFFRFRQFSPDQCAGPEKTITLTAGVKAVICVPKGRATSVPVDPDRDMLADALENDQNAKFGDAMRQYNRIADHTARIAMEMPAGDANNHAKVTDLLNSFHRLAHPHLMTMADTDMSTGSPYASSAESVEGAARRSFEKLQTRLAALDAPPGETQAAEEPAAEGVGEGIELLAEMLNGEEPYTNTVDLQRAEHAHAQVSARIMRWLEDGKGSAEL